MPIEFDDEKFLLEGSTFEIKLSPFPQEERFLNGEIEKLLKKGGINESTHETQEFISPIFLVPKSPNSCRLILYLKKLNEPYTHFKMETINPILTMITPNCYMVTSKMLITLLRFQKSLKNI